MDKIDFDRLSVLDVISIASQHDSCIVFPTHDHAIALWPTIRQAMFDRHDRERVKPSKTALFMYRTRTTLRLWVPYERQPTQVMDYPEQRAKLLLLSPYARREAW